MVHEPSTLATGLWPNEARGPENDTSLEAHRPQQLGAQLNND